MLPMTKIQDAYLDHEGIERFRKHVYAFYAGHARRFPWRETTDPYRILVSEFMLQQTQVERVSGKYEEFLSSFPNFDALAGADLAQVLKAWQGLGYNRRAVSLLKTARTVVEVHGGALPRDIDALLSLPGIGRSTAGAVLAFAYNIPAAFIETNIRRVFIHAFFPGQDKVSDREILPLLEAALDRENPRDWHYALMDYGTMLKGAVANPNRKSAHYVRQQPFEGSDRQIRGWVLKTLVAGGSLEAETLVKDSGRDPVRIYRILGDLVREGFITKAGGVVSIA